MEALPGETRVAATPDTAKKFLSLGCSVSVERGAGIASGYLDQAYADVGAELTSPADQSVWGRADLVLCVQTPSKASLAWMKRQALVAGLLSPYNNEGLITSLQSGGLSAIALELLPRISRAQSADALSSQANIAGYKAVLLASSALDRYFPMLMTAAGTIHPAKVFIIGAGVAGLMAISTARRLGAVVEAYDTRVEVKEQVESLGAKFVEFDLPQEEGTSAGGYAKQQSEEFYKAQREQMSAKVAQSDLVITTAAIPGKPSPRLVTADMLKCMKKGSVIVDLAAERGGNVEGTEKNKKIVSEYIPHLMHELKTAEKSRNNE